MQLIEYIKNPFLVESFNLAEFHELTEKYPYVATYQLLYLIALKKSGRVEFEEELQKRSIYFNQPEYIEKYFSDGSIPVNVVDVNEFTEEVVEDEVVPQETVEETLVEPSIQETKKEEETFVRDEENSAPTIENKQEDISFTDDAVDLHIDDNEYYNNLRKLGLDHLIPKIHQVETTDSDEEIVQEEIPVENSVSENTEEEILVENTNSESQVEEIPVETFEEINEEIIEETTDEVQPEKETLSTEVAIETLSIEEIPLEEADDFTEIDENTINTQVEEEVETRTIPIDLEEVLEAESMPFYIEEISAKENKKQEKPKVTTKKTAKKPSSKAQAKKKPGATKKVSAKKTVKKPAEKEIVKEEEVVEQARLEVGNRTFSQWVSLKKAPINKEQQIDVKEKKGEIIDQFLEKNPKISPLKDTAESNLIDINSLVEDDQISHLMTETLAKLYVSQRKYGKAIEAYEILSLKNPEKSNIFAVQIEKLKKLK